MRAAKKYQMEFMEVSSKDGTNINALFNKLIEKVSEYVKSLQKSSPD